MRVMILLDDLRNAEACNDLQRVIPYLNTERLQLQLYAQKGEGQFGDLTVQPAPKTILGLVKLLRDQDIELIHALEPGVILRAGIAGRFADIATLATYPQILPLHMSNWLLWKRQQIITQWTLSLFDRIIVSSEISKRHLGYVVNFPHERIEIVYPGVDVSPIDPPKRADLDLPEGPLVTVILPSALDTSYEMLLDMIVRLKHRFPDVHLAMIGTGALIHHLQRKASNIRPALPIRWLGARSDLRTVLASSDVIVDHPMAEMLPTALIEAAAAAKPVVAARAKWVTEIVEPTVTGLLVTPGDSSDMAIQVGRLLAQPALAHRMGLAAHRHAKALFSIEAQREAMLVLYESTIYSKR